MSISGGIKFFDRSKALSRDGATITATSGDDSSIYTLSLNKYIGWTSVGSTDATTETLNIDLITSKTINIILLVDHNFKEFTVKYWNGSTYVDFTTVTGIDGTLGGGISETSFSQDTAYYEFDEISTTKIEITITKTQTVDAQKSLIYANITSEIGTFDGFPNVNNVSHSRNSRIKKSLSFKDINQKSYETVAISMDLMRYPGQNDIDIIDILHTLDETFQIWLCGGRYGTTYFRFAQRGWNLKDIYNVQMIDDLGATYADNVYVHGVNKTLTVNEAV